IEAKAAAGNVFVGWTGTIETNKARFAFSMQSNMVLQANIIPNPIIPVRGSYYGLFAEAAGVQQNSSGFFSATVTPTTNGGVFSAKAQIGLVTNSFSGSLDLSGHGHAVRMSHGTNVLTLDFLLDLEPGGDRLAGAISSPNWTADLIANRSVF